MSDSETNWSTQQLAEFLAVVSSYADEVAAVHGAIERAAEALEAEVGAIVRGDAVVASTGFATDEQPDDALIAAAQGRIDAIDVPGVGPCPSISVSVGDEDAGHMVLARYGADGFTRDEASLVRGMGRVLALALAQLGALERERRAREASEQQAQVNARLLRELQERQTLLESLARVQRAIVERAPVQQVLDTVVEGVRELLNGDIVGMCLIDPSAPDQLVVVADSGMSSVVLEATHRRPIGVGVSGRAVAERELIVVDAERDPEAMSGFVDDGARIAMAAPVYEDGEVSGSIVVASRAKRAYYGAIERDALLAFAEHATIALTDAKTVSDAMHQAFHDELTGLPNRALFLDRLELALARAQRSEDGIAVLFLDLDSFKTVNDSLGHAAGDRLLVEVADRLRLCVRPADTAARFGGDEFAILLEGTDHSAATGVAQRILDVLRDPVVIDDREVFVSASIGVADGRSQADDLLRNADLAMYRAKSEGKSRFAVFEPRMHAAVVERLELEVDLQRAIEHGEFILHYQPIVTLPAGEIVGVEALVRWNHPRRGLLAPATFVPLAEETRLVEQIGRWVLHEATRRVARWRDSIDRCGQLAISVNISPDQLDQPGLVDDVATGLRSAGLPPGALILEITESVLMHDIEATIERLRTLKRLGVRLAVDDFGTGYSSLQYLRRFPIDILKIAKSFIDGLGAPDDESTLARAIIDLAESFRLQVIAEGIELDVQTGRLVELGCRLGQGFHFGRPLPAEQMGELLALQARERAGSQAPGDLLVASSD